MNSLAWLKDFIRSKHLVLVFIGVVLLVVIFSVPRLNSWPRLWTDEALTIELANNFSRTGTLNVETSPGHFFESPYLLQSTGYPLTILLALIFKIFGVSLTAGRLLMLVLMIVALLLILFFGKKIFENTDAILAVLLIATFASFYGSGRTIVGEIPGFIFLISSIYFLFVASNHYLGGLLLGLAVVTKPSVFLLALPAVALVVLIERKDFFKKCLQIGAAVILPVLAWVFLIIGNPVSKSVWVEILNFYKNPYGSVAISTNITDNLLSFFHSTTLIYFGALFLAVIAARYFGGQTEQAIKSVRSRTQGEFAPNPTAFSVYNFAIFYSIFAFIYYLRSPGWLRYILIAELLILFVLPSALSVIFKKNNKIVLMTVLFLSLVQLIHLGTSAQIYSSDSAIKTAAFVNENFPGESVGVYDSLEISALLKTKNRYQKFTLMGVPTIGTDFLVNGTRPRVVLLRQGDRPSEEVEGIMSASYKQLSDINGYQIFELKDDEE